MNLAGRIFQNSARYPDKPAVIFAGRTYTYRGLEEKVGKYADLLARLGVGKGDRVALQLRKGMEFIFLHLANLSLGAVTLPLNPAYTPEEVRYFLEDSGSSLFFSGGERGGPAKAGAETIKAVFLEKGSSASLATLLEESPEKGGARLPQKPTRGEDVALLCYTSGTTGRPKAAMITHRNLVSNTLALQAAWRWAREDVLLHVLPLFHIHGLCVALHGALHVGATVIMHEGFDPKKVLESLAKEGCTVFMAVPTIYFRLMEAWPEEGPDLSSMRLFTSGSAPLSGDLFRQFQEATGFRILERYGMTETQMIASNPYEPEGRTPKSVGFPLPGVEIRLVSGEGADVKPGEVGEVWVRGENVFKGYWQMPEKTREAFAGDWFRTGDLGCRDQRYGGSLFLAGRAKELIITGGYNVYPREVEDVITGHEGVQESAVLGIDDPEYGEKVAAAVVLKKGGPPVSEAELLAFLKGKLAGYKCPRKVVFLEALPRNAMGKVQKHLIRL